MSQKNKEETDYCIDLNLIHIWPQVSTGKKGEGSYNPRCTVTYRQTFPSEATAVTRARHAEVSGYNRKLLWSQQQVLLETEED